MQAAARLVRGAPGPGPRTEHVDRRADRSLEPRVPRGFIPGVVAVTFLAVVLRMFRLDEWALWVDEAHTFRDATGDTTVFWERSHVSRYPLSYLMLRQLMGWMPSVGEGWLRLPFALFGIFSVPALAIVGRWLVGTRVALFAALLLALHPWHLYWSQNVRNYPMVCFFAICAVGAGFQAMRRRSLGHAVAAVVLCALAGFSHPSGHAMFFVLAGAALLSAQVAGDRITRKGKLLLRWMVFFIALAVAAAIPKLLPAIEHFSRAKSGSSPIHLVQTLVFFLRVVLIPFALCGAFWMLRSTRLARQRASLLVVTWAMLPPLLLFCATFGLGFRVTAQYAFASLPAWCILAAVPCIAVYDLFVRALTRGGRRREDAPVSPWRARWDALSARGIAVSIGAVLILDLAAYDFLYFTVQKGDRPRWREGAHAVLADAHGQSVHVLTTNWPSMRYYLAPGSFWGRQREDRTIESIEDFVIANEPYSGDADAWFLAERESARAEGRTLYIVSTEPELDEKHRSLDHLFRSHGQQIVRLPCWTGPKDMTVQVFRIEPLAEADGTPDGSQPPTSDGEPPAGPASTGG